MSNSTYWCTDAGAGDNSGDSLANAATFDPAGADIFTIINALTLTTTATVRICGNCSTTATASVTLDGSTTNTVIWQGRNAGDTADAEVTIDAGGGSFYIFTLTTADYHEWRHIRATNTASAAAQSAWFLSSNADYNHFYLCTGDNCYRGWDGSGADRQRYEQCLAHNNASYGFFVQGHASQFHDCVSHDNGSYGFIRGVAINCISYGNGNDGYNDMDGAINCIAYLNTAAGFNFSNGWSQLCVNCITMDNSEFGYEAQTGRVILHNCADYSDTSGRKTGNVQDNNAIALTADPFVAVGSGNFSLNGNAGGGLLCRKPELILPGAASTTYRDIGAVQVGGGLLTHPGMRGGTNG